MKDENIIKFKIIDGGDKDERNVSQLILDYIYELNNEEPMSYSRVIGELEIAKQSLLRSFFDGDNE